MPEPPDKTAAPDSTAPTESAYADDLFCPECGYSLRGLTSERCPECGLDLGFIESDISVIPWEHRREIGRFKAYWKTVWLVLFRSRVFQRAGYQPVSEHDARRFRAACILHAFVPFLLALGMLTIFEPVFLHEVAEYAGVWFVPFVCVCILAWLFVHSGLPSYIYDSPSLTPKERERIAALAQYTCAPLAGTPVAFLVYCFGLALRNGSPTAGHYAFIIAGALAFGMLFGAYIEPDRIRKRLFPSRRDRMLLDLKLGLAWFVCFLGIMCGLPLSVWLIYVIAHSLG